MGAEYDVLKERGKGSKDGETKQGYNGRKNTEGGKDIKGIAGELEHRSVLTHKVL